VARDLHGFEQGRKRDEQGRPLKLQTPPATEAYMQGWDRVFTCQKCGGKLRRGACWECNEEEIFHGRR
jgi:hypothetical protein